VVEATPKSSICFERQFEAGTRVAQDVPTKHLVVGEECKRYVARFRLKIWNSRKLATSADEPPQTPQGGMQRLERARMRETVKKLKNKMTKLGKKNK
jgi:hypothetical protein